ncbi:hypothetical protein QJS10_CPA09g01680 [Acorus calamus]|uniref:Uncharacterized protein n=1 Tax=Acorus calamus TaxID=4465 RepID=A0AAV9E8A9_ACOCL|nr:hypothetical protein QJS10_CPA09g01680 [Acorus calamus]
MWKRRSIKIVWEQQLNKNAKRTRVAKDYQKAVSILSIHSSVLILPIRHSGAMMVPFGSESGAITSTEA